MCFDVCLHLEKTDDRCQPCGLVPRPYFFIVNSSLVMSLSVLVPKELENKT